MNNNEVISILNGLVESCKRGQEAFRAAADGIRNSEFRRLFNIFAQQRTQFTSELQAEIHRLGGDAGKDAATTATARPAGNTIPVRLPSTPEIRAEAPITSEC